MRNELERSIQYDEDHLAYCRDLLALAESNGLGQHADTLTMKHHMTRVHRHLNDLREQAARKPWRKLW